MVPNGSAYDNYPSFANNGTKTPPGGSTESAKYALGMVPADTFPAEWANYLFHGATAGITRLNSDTGSIKKEINTVLSNFNITPDATLNNQLMAALTKLKAEAALAAHPVGSLYWTSSAENPATTFGGGTWVQIKDRFILAAGDTYTTVNAGNNITNGGGGGSATVTLTKDQIPSHTHNVTAAGTVGNKTATGSISGGSYDFSGTRANTESNGSAHYHSFTTGGMSANATGAVRVVDGGHVPNAYKGNISVGSNTTSGNKGVGSDTTSSNYELRIDVSHTHSGDTGWGSADHAHAYTPKGTISIASNPTFTGTAHNHSFTGSEVTSVATGGGQAHNNMPPYIVKYCWERTA